MAGSISNRRYISDNGINYSIKVDKSNASGNISGDGRALCGLREANYPLLPRGFGKRYILAFQQDNPRIKRKFFVGNPSVLGVALAPGATILAPSYAAADGTAGRDSTFVITAYRGEKQQISADYQADDSGLDDGSVIQ